MEGPEILSGEARERRFSAGLATLQKGDRSVEQLIARADAALYEAKSRGRDRMVEFEPAAMAAAS